MHRVIKLSIEYPLNCGDSLKAIIYKNLLDNIIQCNVCNHRCIIESGSRGKCGVRENQSGVLYALSYGKTIATHIDPIEKKPLNDFMPGTRTYSIATVGCNMNCSWCQNHSISQQPKPINQVIGTIIPPLDHIKQALLYQVPSISYTYTEPTVYIEYALDIMKLAHKNGLKNIWVSNGYMSDEALDVIIPYLDAINIDYKGSENAIYEQYCSGHSKYVLSNIRRLFFSGIHVEITTLIVPAVNDSINQINQIAQDIAEISKDIPWHISRFFPAYKMKETSPTDKKILYEAKRIGQEAGLTKIYLGNI